MRKKTKYLLTGAAIGSAVAVALDVLMQLAECMKEGKPFSWENFNGRRTLKAAAIGGGIGTGIGAISYHFSREEDRQTVFDSNDYLSEVLREESIKSDPGLLNKVLQYRTRMKEWLANEFGDLLVTEPLDNGSFYKRTANRSNFDLDITLVFAKKTRMTLAQIFEMSFESLKKKFGDVAVIKRRTRVISVEFTAGSEVIKFDIVPARERGNFKKDAEVTLYVQPEWFWQEGSSFKTNLDRQRSATRNKPEARRAIRLLKAYRDRNNLDIPTVMIEQCCIDALSKNKFGTEWSDKENLLNAMDTLAARLQQKQIIDVSNTNNNLVDKVSEMERLSASQLLYSDIEEIEKDPRYLKEIFEI
ncbi:MAG TPA: hypothetical protein VEB86_18025 [Chryseosolibacter sp.]|nr:hypothetical protein [Chryseosolibacter sp.]